MRIRASLRTLVGRSLHSTTAYVKRSKQLASQQRIANAVRCSIEPLETRTLLAATPLYWDPSAASTAVGGTGTWDTATAEWRSGSATGSLVVWNNTGDANGLYEAVFPSGDGTVTLGTNVSAGSIYFVAANTTVSGGSGSDVLTLGTGQIDVASGSMATIAAAVSAPFGITKTSAGTLNLTGTVADAASADLNVSAGSLTVSNSESWQTVQVGSAGMLVVQGSALLLASGSISDYGLVDHNGGAIQTPALDISGGAFSDAAGSLTGLAGGLTIGDVGIFNSVNDQSLAGTVGQFVVDGNGIYEVQNATGSGTTTLSMNFVIGSGTVDVAAGILSIPNPINMVDGSNMTLDGSGTLVLPTLDDADGTVVQTAGTVDMGSLTIGDHFESGAQYVLTGGTLAIGSMGLGGFSTASFNQSGGNFYDGGNSNIGLYGNGTYLQTGGFSLFGQLEVGEDGHGTYQLLGGSTSQGSTIVGQTESGNPVGTGIFIQSGSSTSSFGNLIVGHYGGVNSVYELESGTLNVQSEYVGSGNGATGASFIQTGGIQTVANSIDLGDGTGCTASYNISGGSLTAANLFVGQNSGQAVYEQSGGTVSLSGVLLGGVYAASTNILLSGGSLSVGENAYVGYTSPATFNQTGGTLSVTDDLIMSGDEVAQDPAGNGIFLLSGSSQVTASRVFVGYSANGSLLLSRGTLTTNALVLNGPAGTVGNFSNQSGGTLTAANIINILKPAASGASLVDEGSAYTLDLSATSNYGNNAITSWGILWGDGASGTAAGSANSSQHTYFIGGQTYTINATAYSNGDSFASAPVSVLVNDLPGSVTPIASQSVNTGSLLTISTTFTDPGIDETHTVQINWGDGSNFSTGTVTESGGSGTITASHVYAVHSTSPYTATMYVTDSGGAMAVVTFPVTALYVPPIVSVVPPANPPATGLPTNIQLHAVDPEAGLIRSWTVNWGDGSTQTIDATSTRPIVNGSDSEWDMTHTYPSPGTYTIHATATDTEGSYNTSTQSLTVQQAPPGLVIDIRDVDGGKSATATSVGQVIPLQVWAVVTGSDTDGANDAISSFAGSFISSMASATSVHGDLSDSYYSIDLNYPANGTQLGTQQNLNGDGNLDIGSDDGSSIAGYFNARAGGMVTGTVIGASDEILIATIDYTVISLPSGGGETDVNFFPRPVVGPGYAAEWQQDGQPENETTSTLAAGIAFRINAGSQTVPVPAQPSITPDLSPASGINPPSLSGSTVVALNGSSSFGISLASGEYTFTQGTSTIDSVAASALEGFTFTGGGFRASLAISGTGADPTLLNDAGSDGTSLAITVGTGAEITFNTTEHLYSLTIHSGATAKMAANGRSVLVTSSLLFDGSQNTWAGTLDLGNNGLIVSGGNLATITNLLKSGYSGGTWNGPGIDSSTAAANDQSNALGVISNQKSGALAYYSTFDGQAVSASDILVQYTYYGDLNLDGQADGTDYSLIDNGYAKGLTGWMNGDLNYDSVVDGSDYDLMDNGFNIQGARIVNPGTGVLAPPRNLDSSNVASGVIGLSWVDDASSADAPYDTIYESTNNGASFVQIHSTAAVPAGSVNTYTVTGLAVGCTYQFYIRCGGGTVAESAPSDTSILSTAGTPVAVAASFNLNENQTLTVPADEGILVGDYDTDPTNTLSAILVSGPSNGVLNLNGNGSFAYQPDAGYTGSDSFTYVAVDQGMDSQPTTVTLNVVPESSITSERLFTVRHDSPLQGTVLLAGSPLESSGTVSLSQNVSNGTLSLSSGGSFTYQPYAGFSGQDSFSCIILDGEDGPNPPVNVTVNIDVTEALPIAVDAEFSGSEGAVITGSLASDAVSPNGGTLTFNLNIRPSNAQVFALHPNGTFSYTPAGSFEGTDSFSYTVSDGVSSSNSATVSLVVNDNTPVSMGGYFSGPAGAPITGNVLTNDWEADSSQPLTVTPENVELSGGSLVLSSNGSFTYIPQSGFVGEDSFTYADVNDGETSTPATVILDITDNTPSAIGDSFTGTAGQALQGSVAINNELVASGSVQYAIVEQPGNGIITAFDPSSGEFTYQPSSNGEESDTFTYSMSNGQVTSTAEVSIVLLAPLLSTTDQSYSVDIGSNCSGNVLTSAYDSASSSLTVTSWSDPSQGTLAHQTDGSFTYTPTASGDYSDSFQYTATDGITSSTSTVTIDVLDIPRSYRTPRWAQVKTHPLRFQRPI